MVSAPGNLADFDPPSSTSTSQVPEVALLTSNSQAIPVGLDLTLMPVIGSSPFLVILTCLMSLRLAPLISRRSSFPDSRECDGGLIPLRVGNRGADVPATS